jgi:uncharacterized protein (DUF1697 family)
MSGTGHNDAMASHVALLRGINVGGRNKVVVLSRDELSLCEESR